VRVIAALVFVAAVAGLASTVLVQENPTARQQRETLFRELQPVTLANCTLDRIGSPNDGGYLMCGNLLSDVQSAYSYGIGPADDWGCEISDMLGVPVHQYDCFSPPEAACPNGRSTFHYECVGSRTQTADAREFDTFPNQLSKNGDLGKTLVVKIDIEGAELDALMATPTAVLARIDQLAMEIHGTDRRFLELVRRLKRNFYLVHIHYNNQACTPRFKPFPAWAFQALWVNKRIGVVDTTKGAPILPNPLDAPDYAQGKDCQTPIQ
jgi:hypothetical protein